MNLRRPSEVELQRGRDGDRVVRNAGYNLAGQVVPIVVALAAMPVIVRELGAAGFGLLALAWTVVGYFSLFDLGLGRAATQRIAGASVRGDAQAVARAAATVTLAHAGMGAIAAALLWLTAPVLAGVLVPGGGELVTEGRTMLRVLALGLPGVLLMNAYRSVLEGLSRFDLVNAVRAPFSALNFLIPLAGVLVGASLPVIVAGLVVGRYAAAGVYAWLCRRALPAGAAERAELRALVRFGGWVAVSNALVPVVVYLERLIVTAQQGPAALAYYAAPHELVARLLVVPGAVAAVLYPVFTGLYARGEPGAVARGVAGALRVVAVLFTPVVLLAVLFAVPVLGVWLGADYAARGGLVLRLLATAAFLNALAYVPFVVLEGLGRPDLVAKYHAVELPLYAALAWLLVARWGIEGAALAWLLRTAWLLPILSVLAFRAAGVDWLAPVLRPTLQAAALSGAAIGAAHMLAWAAGDALLIGAVLPLLYALVAWRWLLTPEDRGRLTGWRRRVDGSERVTGLASAESDAAGAPLSR